MDEERLFAVPNGWTIEKFAGIEGSARELVSRAYKMLIDAGVDNHDAELALIYTVMEQGCMYRITRSMERSRDGQRSSEVPEKES